MWERIFLTTVLYFKKLKRDIKKINKCVVRTVNLFLYKIDGCCVFYTKIKSYLQVFIYDYHESSKGEDDIFKEVKSKAFSLSSKFEKVGNLIKWHSIKLPANRSNSLLLTETLILDFAVADAVLKKFPLESLILFGRPNMEVRLDYFNRVSYCLFNLMFLLCHCPKLN